MDGLVASRMSEGIGFGRRVELTVHMSGWHLKLLFLQRRGKNVVHRVMSVRVRDLVHIGCVIRARLKKSWEVSVCVLTDLLSYHGASVVVSVTFEGLIMSVALDTTFSF